MPAASTKREPRASAFAQLASVAAGINDEADIESLPSDVRSAAASLALRPPISPRPSKPRLRRNLSAVTESLLIPEDDNNSRLSGASSLRSNCSALSQGSGPSAFRDASARPSDISPRTNSGPRARRVQFSETTQARLFSGGNDDSRPTGAFTGSLRSQRPASSAYTELRPRAHTAAGEAISAPSLASSQRSGVMYMDCDAAPQFKLTPERTQAVNPGLATGTPVGRHQQIPHLPSHRAVAQEDSVPLPQAGIPSLHADYDTRRRRSSLASETRPRHQQGRASAREGSDDLTTRAARGIQPRREADLQVRRDHKQDILRVRIVMVKEHIRIAEKKLYHHRNQAHPSEDVDQQAQAQFYKETEDEIHDMQRQLRELERDYKCKYGSPGSGASGGAGEQRAGRSRKRSTENSGASGGAGEQRAGRSRKRSTENSGARDSADNPPIGRTAGGSMARGDAGAPNYVATGVGGDSEDTASHVRRSGRKWMPSTEFLHQFE